MEKYTDEFYMCIRLITTVYFSSVYTFNMYTQHLCGKMIKYTDLSNIKL